MLRHILFAINLLRAMPAYCAVCLSGAKKLVCAETEGYMWFLETYDGDQTKYPYVVHAELNAVLNANGRDLRGSKLYVALFPCNECAKAIIQSGISEVVYYGDKYHDSDSSVAARFMFKKAGVRLTAYTPSGRKELLEL